MRTLLEVLHGPPQCPRAIFMHLPRGYAITAIEHSNVNDLEWHQTLEDAAQAFFSEPTDCAGVVFSEPHKQSPDLQVAEWWKASDRPKFFRDSDPWIRPFASLPSGAEA